MDKKKPTQSLNETLKTEVTSLKDAAQKEEKKGDWECEDECLEKKDDNYCGKTDHL